MEQSGGAGIRVVVLLEHRATWERTRATARRGLGIEVARPDATDPGALHLVTEGRRDVLILDLRLPEINGGEIGDELRGQFTGLSVIVLDGYDHVAYLRGLAALASDAFSRRGFEEADLVAAAYAAVDRRCLLPAEMLLSPSEWLLEPLTPREYETLWLMAAGRHNRDIADELGIAVKTVEFHVRHVMEKLGVHGRVEAILRARELSSQRPSVGAA